MTTAEINVDIDTVFFCDCDGVINVGIGEMRGSIAFDTNNLKRSVDMMRDRLRPDSKKDSPSDRIAEAILACASRNLEHGENSTYRKMVSDPATGFSDVLVGRLADLITMAGDRRMVVLSSTWRDPKHAKRCATLEHAMSKSMGKLFAFDATTALFSGELPANRLQLIGDFVEELCAERARSAVVGDLKVVVLDDFDCTPMGTWSCAGSPMLSSRSVEEYIEKRGNGMPVVAKMIHTIDLWTAPSGNQIRLGAGLINDHFCDAAQFLGSTCDACKKGVTRPAAGADSRKVATPTTSQTPSAVSAIRARGADARFENMYRVTTGSVSGIHDFERRNSNPSKESPPLAPVEPAAQAPAASGIANQMRGGSDMLRHSSATQSPALAASRARSPGSSAAHPGSSAAHPRPQSPALPATMGRLTSGPPNVMPQVSQSPTSPISTTDPRSPQRMVRPASGQNLSQMDGSSPSVMVRPASAQSNLSTMSARIQSRPASVQSNMSTMSGRIQSNQPAGSSYNMPRQGSHDQSPEMLRQTSPSMQFFGLSMNRQTSGAPVQAVPPNPRGNQMSQVGTSVPKTTQAANVVRQPYLIAAATGG